MRIFCSSLLWFFTSTCLAGQVEVQNLRTWPAPDHTRIVLDISGPVEHKIFTLQDPDRVVVDLRSAVLRGPLESSSPSERLVARVRSATRNKQDLRVVLDLRSRVRPKSFLLKPNSNYGHRLVIDLFPGTDTRSEPRVVKASPDVQKVLRDVTVVIDPGHGGEDPGATGHSGIREKQVTFAVGQKLANLINQQRGMRAVMVRTGDYYIGLRKRMKIARDSHADLFVSIHADAFQDSRVHGSSVYVLSRNGASSEAARWLAEQENAADLVGGVSLDDKDDLLASVLLDLSQTATLSASTEAGADVLEELKTLGKTHKKSVQRAGFVVLKSPDIPSILVETAFISNPDEERKLTKPGHQKRLAAAIMSGVRNYFEHHAPPGTLLALRKHVITRGDTLSELADRYRVPVSTLKSTNRLNGNVLKIGQVLRIPNSQGS